MFERPFARSPLAVLTAVVLGLAPVVGAQGSLDHVRSVFQARGVYDDRTAGELIDQLVALDNQGIAPLFQVYAEGGLDEMLKSGNSYDLSEGWWGRAPDRFGEMAFLALARLSPNRVVEHIRSRCTAAAPLARRVSGLRLLGELGSARGLAVAYEIASEMSEAERQYRTVAVAMKGCFARILQGDRTAVEEVESFLPVLDGVLLVTTLEALGSSRRGEAMDVLIDLLGEEEGLDELVLDQIGTLGESCPWRVTNDPRPRVRMALYDDEWRVRRSAAACAGRLTDADSARDLLALLEDDSPRVRSAAQWALGSLADNPDKRDSQDWELWIEREERRWDDEYDPGRLHLAELEASESVGVVRRASLCTLYRRDAAQLIAEALEHDEPQVIAAAAVALQRMGALATLPDLVAALRSRDEAARSAVWQCLRALTGEDRPLDPVSWRAFLDLG